MKEVRDLQDLTIYDVQPIMGECASLVDAQTAREFFIDNLLVRIHLIIEMI